MEWVQLILTLSLLPCNSSFPLLVPSLFISPSGSFIHQPHKHLLSTLHNFIHAYDFNDNIYANGSHLFNDSEASNPSKDFSPEVPKDQTAQWTFCLRVSQITPNPAYPKGSHLFHVCFSSWCLFLRGDSCSHPITQARNQPTGCHLQPVTKT